MITREYPADWKMGDEPYYPVNDEKNNALYEKYKDKGLSIVGISLDNSQEKWQEATKRLAITWPQMSDLKGWDNAAARALNVNSIPHTIIVNQQGEIIKRDLRGAELEALISSLLK